MRACESGFTLVEFMVATTITLIAAGLAVALVVPAGSAFQSLPEAADLQQRLRVATDALRTDLAKAGSGPGLAWGGGSSQTWPAVLPCRWTGAPLGSVAGGCARSDSITIVAVETTAPQALTDVALEDPAQPIAITAVSACTLDRSACRLHAGNMVLIIDGTSAWDLLPLSSVSADGRLVSTQGRRSSSYSAGALIAETTARSYYLAPEAGTGITQLRRVDDAGSSFPLVDHAVALTFEYFGAPEPPRMTNADDPARRAATYGPVPPPVGTDNSHDSWPAGENCTFAVNQGLQVPRLSVLAADFSGLSPLPVSMLGDGPWCPDDASPNRFDADLLRIRMARVTIRVQAQSAAVRGTAPSWFAQPGTSRDALRMVPDMIIGFDVALRNLQR